MMFFVVIGIGGEGWSGGPFMGLGEQGEGQGVEERGREGMGEGWSGFEEFEILGLFRPLPLSSLPSTTTTSSPPPRGW